MQKFKAFGSSKLNMRRHASAQPQHNLDTIDLRIIATLQDDGRIIKARLSEQLGISGAPCVRRIRALEESGYIRGYHADIDAEKCGFKVCGFVFVGLESQSSANLRSFEQLVLKWPEVRECYALSGNIDFLLKCYTRDLEQLQHFISQNLMKAENVKVVKTSVNIHTVKHAAGVPILDGEIAKRRSTIEKNGRLSESPAVSSAYASKAILP